MASDFTNPKGSSGWTSMLSQIRSLFASVATLFDGGPADTNIPTNAKRIDQTDNQVYNYNAGWNSLGYVMSGTEKTKLAGIEEGATAGSGTLTVYVSSAGSGDGSGSDASNTMAGSAFYNNYKTSNGVVTTLDIIVITTETCTIRVPASITASRFMINSTGTCTLQGYNDTGATTSLNFYASIVVSSGALVLNGGTYVYMNQCTFNHRGSLTVTGDQFDTVSCSVNLYLTANLTASGSPNSMTASASTWNVVFSSSSFNISIDEFYAGFGSRVAVQLGGISTTNIYSAEYSIIVTNTYTGTPNLSTGGVINVY